MNNKTREKFNNYVSNIARSLQKAKLFFRIGRETGIREKLLKKIHIGYFTVVYAMAADLSILELVKVWEDRDYSRSNGFSIASFLDYIRSQSDNFGLTDADKTTLWDKIKYYSEKCQELSNQIIEFQNYRDKKIGHIDKNSFRVNYTESMHHNFDILIDLGFEIINTFNSLINDSEIYDTFTEFLGEDYKFLDKLTIRVD